MNGNITSGSITKSQREFNKLNLKDVVTGIKEASILERLIRMAHLSKVVDQQIQNKETPVPTANEVRQALENGIYR